MYIEEVIEGERPVDEEEKHRNLEEEDIFSGDTSVVCYATDGRGGLVFWDVKKVVVGLGARALFYPTLLYNVVRNKIQSEFRWWDWIDEFVLLGAVPFPSDVMRLKDLGVCGVVTMNESYETLVPSSLYEAYGIQHLVLPTRDYLFAPSFTDISQAVDFIHENASTGRSTYVHCKAGRGRSTTVVICYLVKYKHMIPDAAYAYVKSIRPRVLLASAQWQAVQDFYHHLTMRMPCNLSKVTSLIGGPKFLAAQDLLAFDDGSVVVITKADLDGYDSICESAAEGNEIWADLNLIYRVRVAGEAALARFSCLWLRYHTQKMVSQKLTGGSKGSIAEQLGGITVDIHLYQ